MTETNPRHVTRLGLCRPPLDEPNPARIDDIRPWREIAPWLRYDEVARQERLRVLRREGLLTRLAVERARAQ